MLFCGPAGVNVRPILEENAFSCGRQWSIAAPSLRARYNAYFSTALSPRAPRYSATRGLDLGSVCGIKCVSQISYFNGQGKWRTSNWRTYSLRMTSSAGVGMSCWITRKKSPRCVKKRITINHSLDCYQLRYTKQTARHLTWCLVLLVPLS